MALAPLVKNISSFSLPSLIYTPSDTDTDTDTDTDQNTDTDSDVEVDLLEEVELDITDYDRDMPTRPASRLGFNRALIQGHRQMEDKKPLQTEKTSHLHSAVTLRWTKSLFQKTNTQAAAANATISETVLETAVSPSSSSDTSISDSNSSTSAFSSSNENTSSEDFHSTATILHFPAPPRASRSQSKPQTGKNTPFPLIRSSGPSPLEHKPKPTPGPLFATTSQGRPKFSCLPSPFSPMSSPRAPTVSPFFAQTQPNVLQKPHPNPLRHTYANHGHSRNALLQIKCFWAVRHEEWIHYETECAIFGACSKTDIFSSNDDGAYGGLEIVPGTAHFGFQSSRPPPVPPARPSENNTTPPAPAPTPLTVHPRTGDISALRDPYCMHIDVCFAGLPLWTLWKTLWMFEVHRLDGGRCTGAGDGQNGEEGREASGVRQELDIEMTRSTSVGCSEASDVTLVEDVPMAEPAYLSALEIDKAAKKDAQERTMDMDIDTDMDMDMSMIQDDEGFFEKYLLEDIDLGDTDDAGGEVLPGLGLHTSEPTQTQPTLGTTTTTTPKESNPHTAPSQPPLACSQPWELTWYARWELLIELVRRDQARGQGIVPGAAPGKDKPGRRMFYLGDDEDDEDDGSMEVDDDGEEDDYGVLVANPVYPPSRVFDAGICD